ncbi:hypothetical protein EMPS_09361 [Entomortierella parvispora]|uniref:Brl1/Brr6 domain-containing protein n=1 Tax=Entomortierella parvispora TaxID=205924 RepID=A0A9P3M0B3_9FUNG|nr:hypothetical protein EMPS_09361 [Entomortierella parvispora]
MARMTIRSREAPMDWERENERDHPNIFSNQQPSPLQSESLSSTPAPMLSQQSTFGSFSLPSGQMQRDSSFTSQSSQASFTSGWNSPASKPFSRDSQLPATGLLDPTNVTKHGSGFSLSRESSFARPHSPSSPSANDGAAAAAGFGALPSLSKSTSRGSPSAFPIHDKKTSFDMGSLRKGVQPQEQDSLQSVRSGRAGSALHRKSTMLTTGSSSDEDMGRDEDEDEAMEVDDQDSFDNRGSYRDDGLYEKRTSRGLRNRNWESIDNRVTRRTGRYQSPATKKTLVSKNERGWTENVDLPYIIAGYVQVGMNSAAAMALFYILWNFFVTIQSDVSSRMESLLEGERRRIQQCEIDYKRYNCIEPLPLTFANCERWKACMHMPEPRIGRATVSAETFAMIVNSFVNTISYKTMAFVMVLVFGGLYISNLAISSYRSNHILHHQHTIVPPSLPQQDLAANRNVSGRLNSREESSRLIRDHQQPQQLLPNGQQSYSLQRHGSLNARRPTFLSNYSDDDT